MKYQLKNPVVEARRFDVLDLGEQDRFAEWCDGNIRGRRLADRERVIRIAQGDGRDVEAEFGDWVILPVDGPAFVVKDEDFHARYEPAPSSSPPEVRA